MQSLVAGSGPRHKSRVVYVSSACHLLCPVNFDDPAWRLSDDENRPLLDYAQSKTANILMAKYINDFCGPRGVHAFAVDRGLYTVPIFAG